MDYYSKYLKYKKKYLQLKGGSNKNQIETIESCISKNLNNNIKIKNCIEKFGTQLLLNEINKLIQSTTNKCLIKHKNKYHLTESCLKKNDKILFTWSNYKIFLADNIKQEIYKIRKLIVDNLIMFIFNNYPPCKINQNIVCNSSPSGSVGPEATLNSDYDLTINGNYKISEIIQMFNSIFEKEFQSTSSEIFDTNLYGYSFLIPNSAVINNLKLWTPVTSGIVQHEINTDETISLEQDKWAYLRIKSFLHNNTSYILNLANTGLNNFYLSHNNNLTTLSAKEKQDKYIFYMSNFEKIMHEQTDNIIETSKINNTKKELIQNLSNMNYYGDETYFTQGAFVHVVGLMYLKNQPQNIKNQLFKKKYYLIHSMMENLGYFIHAYYEHNNDIIYAIKYYNRFINAYNWLINFSSPRIDELDILTSNIKSHIRNREDEYILNNKHIFNMVEVSNSNDVNFIKNHILQRINELIVQLTKTNDYLLSLLFLLEKAISENQSVTNIKITKENNLYVINLN